MVDPADTHGKRIAIVAWGEKPDGSDDVAVFTGVAEWNGSHLTMKRDDADFEIPDEWLEGLRRAEDSMRDTLLGALFYLGVSIGPLPEDANLEDYNFTGLRWPSTDDSD